MGHIGAHQPITPVIVRGILREVLVLAESKLGNVKFVLEIGNLLLLMQGSLIQLSRTPAH